MPVVAAIISNKDIAPISCSKCRTKSILVVDKVVVALGNELLLHVHREDEGPPPRVVGVPCIPGQPGVVREAPDGLAELSVHQQQGVALVVALLVEGGPLEAVLGRPEELLDPGRVVETVFQELQLFQLHRVQNIRCRELPRIIG